MHASGGCAAEGHCYPARRLLGLGGGVSSPATSALPASSSPPLDARALCATTAVLFVASVSYIALSTLFACFRAAGRRPQRRPDTGPEPPQAVETAKRALDDIPVIVVHGSDGRGRSREGEECAVCLAEYASGEEVRVLPACRHGFHRECVDRWLLTRAPTCPVCRAPVTGRSSEGRDTKDCATGDAVLPVAVGP